MYQKCIYKSRLFLFFYKNMVIKNILFVFEITPFCYLKATYFAQYKYNHGNEIVFEPDNYRKMIDSFLNHDHNTVIFFSFLGSVAMLFPKSLFYYNVKTSKPLMVCWSF